MSEGDLRRLAEVTEENFVQILGGPRYGGGVDVTALVGGCSRDQVGKAPGHLSSTPVKIPRPASADVPSSMVVFVESPSKPTVGVVFTLYEPEEVFGRISPSERKRRKSSGEESFRVATSTTGMMTETGLSEMDATVGQGKTAGRVDLPRSFDAALRFELPPREELACREKFFNRVNTIRASALKHWEKTFSS